MGAGGRANLPDAPPVGVQNGKSIKARRARSAKDDLKVLKSLWLSSTNGKDHAERLEAFYGPQAEACALRHLILFPAAPPCLQGAATLPIPPCRP